MTDKSTPAYTPPGMTSAPAPVNYLTTAQELASEADQALASALTGDEPQAWSRFNALCRLAELQLSLFHAQRPVGPVPRPPVGHQQPRATPGGDVDADGFPDYYVIGGQ